MKKVPYSFTRTFYALLVPALLVTFLSYILVAVLLGSCSKKEDISPEIIGKWQAKTMKVDVKYKNGTTETENYTGRSNETIEFVSGGKTFSKNGVFDGFIADYNGKYTLNGSELMIESEFGELEYFTARVSGGTLTLTMDKAQGLRGAQESAKKGENSLMGFGPEDYDDVESLSLTMEFSKQ